MKKPLTLLIICTVLFLASCTSKNKTDYNSDTADTSGYKEQPRDETQMKDTIQMQNRDTAQLHPDTIPH